MAVELNLGEARGRERLVANEKLAAAVLPGNAWPATMARLYVSRRRRQSARRSARLPLFTQPLTPIVNARAS
jgi:hypothetical protein